MAVRITVVTTSLNADVESIRLPYWIMLGSASVRPRFNALQILGLPLPCLFLASSCPLAAARFSEAAGGRYARVGCLLRPRSFAPGACDASCAPHASARIYASITTKHARRHWQASWRRSRAPHPHTEHIAHPRRGAQSDRPARWAHNFVVFFCLARRLGSWPSRTPRHRRSRHSVRRHRWCAPSMAAAVHR